MTGVRYSMEDGATLLDLLLSCGGHAAARSKASSRLGNVNDCRMTALRASDAEPSDVDASQAETSAGVQLTTVGILGYSHRLVNSAPLARSLSGCRSARWSTHGLVPR
jgi:hypothetical protein